jgi:hypothetical protein
MINIEGLKKSEVLAALYNHAIPMELGISDRPHKDMTPDEAEKLLEECTYLDYLKGRILKVNLRSDVEFDESIYDRENGCGTATEAVDSIMHKFAK